jgi:hypothetical protein
MERFVNLGFSFRPMGQVRSTKLPHATKSPNADPFSCYSFPLALFFLCWCGAIRPTSDRYAARLKLWSTIDDDDVDKSDGFWWKIPQISDILKVYSVYSWVVWDGTATFKCNLQNA